MKPEWIAVSISALGLVGGALAVAMGYGELKAMTANNASVNQAQWEVLVKVGDKADKNALDVAEIRGRLD